MPRLLKIADIRSGVFLTMSEILGPLSPEADSLTWSILDLREAVPKEGSGIDPTQIDREAMASPTGLHLTFGELRDLAANLRQVIDGVFVGCLDEGDLPLAKQPDSHIIEQADMVVTAFDSSFWLVAASDPVLDRIGKTFDEVTEIEHAEGR